MPKKLDEPVIARKLSGLTGWSRDGDALRKTYVLPMFADAIAFVNRVAAAADAMDHHPDMDIRYNRVTFTLSTHSEGGLTQLDFDLARRIEELSR
ncbi:MAG: 4a-hydroxytetrahydrobiopterin dehydratase [Gemmatimonadota bacterium]|jgi:4a-hydroxytetrahydrobiopterin dehydratase